VIQADLRFKTDHALTQLNTGKRSR